MMLIRADMDDEGMEYLYVANSNGKVYNGGDQGWREEKAQIKYDGNRYESFSDDEYRRLVDCAAES